MSESADHLIEEIVVNVYQDGVFVLRNDHTARSHRKR